MRYARRPTGLRVPVERLEPPTPMRAPGISGADVVRILAVIGVGAVVAVVSMWAKGGW